MQFDDMDETQAIIKETTPNILSILFSDNLTIDEVTIEEEPVVRNCKVGIGDTIQAENFESRTKETDSLGFTTQNLAYSRETTCNSALSKTIDDKGKHVRFIKNPETNVKYSKISQKRNKNQSVTRKTTDFSRAKTCQDIVQADIDTADFSNTAWKLTEDDLSKFCVSIRHTAMKHGVSGKTFKTSKLL